MNTMITILPNTDLKVLGEVVAKIEIYGIQVDPTIYRPCTLFREDGEILASERCFKETNKPFDINDGQLSFLKSEFPTTNTDWTKAKRSEWWACTGEPSEPFDSLNEPEMDIAMVAWANENNYPTGRE